jgi:hypothetical protein
MRSTQLRFNPGVVREAREVRDRAENMITPRQLRMENDFQTSLTAARAHVIQEVVRDEITWDFQERGRRQALRVVRTIDRPNIANSVDELAVWTTERLVELRRAVVAMAQAAVGQYNAEAMRV